MDTTEATDLIRDAIENVARNRYETDSLAIDGYTTWDALAAAHPGIADLQRAQAAKIVSILGPAILEDSDRRLRELATGLADLIEQGQTARAVAALRALASPGDFVLVAG